MLGDVEMTPAATVLSLHGEIDLVTVEQLRASLDDLTLSTTALLVVDLSQVAFVDVMSLSVILGAADTLRESGRQLLVRGASGSVRRICALLNADDVLAPDVPTSRGAA